jgi:acyl-CoA synthetase (AMP-forming)/AMP-acid ligase II
VICMNVGTLPYLFRSACRWKGDQTFVSDERERLSGDGLWAKSCQFSAALLEHGIGRGDIVAFVCASSTRHLVAFMACQLIGAIPCCLHLRATVKETSRGLEFLEPRVIIADDNGLGLVRDPAKERGLKVISLEKADWAGPEGNPDCESAAVAAANIKANDPALLILSSGTTGQPKAIQHSHRSLVASALAGPYVYGEINDGDRIAVIMPPSFAAWANTVLPFMAMRSQIYFSSWSSAEEFVAFVRQCRISVIPLVPTLWRALLALSPSPSDFPELRSVFFSGEPGSDDLVQGMVEGICPNVRTAYLSSEIVCGAGIVADRTMLTRPGKGACAGRPVPGADVRIVNPDGSIDDLLGPNEVGEIIVSGPSLSPGYYKDEGLTKRAYTNGWLRSGDLGLIDEDGFVHVAGRLDNTINSGGLKVQAEEVEAALLGHSAISQAAVVGVPDQRWGQAVTAHVISLDPAIEQADLLDYLRHSGSLSPYKLPKTIHFHQTLPTGPTGKVLRRALRDT